MPTHELLVWMDLEMTGLDPDRDVILEIATLVTTANLDVVAEGPVLAIHQPEPVLGTVAHGLPDHRMGPEAHGGQADERQEEERQRSRLVTQTHGQMIYPLS